MGVDEILFISKVWFRMAQQVNLSACSPHCYAEAFKQGSCEYQFASLTRLEIRLQSTASAAGSLSTRMILRLLIFVLWSHHAIHKIAQ